jgi:hypothetical protein
MSACCDLGGTRKPPTWARSCREVLAWLLPGALLMLVPKCPACLAAHVAIWTGLGLSFSTAAYLSWLLLALCCASMLYLLITRLGRTTAAYKNFSDRKGSEPCNAKS